MPECDARLVPDRGVQLDRAVLREPVAAKQLEDRPSQAMPPVIAADEEVAQVGAVILNPPNGIAGDAIAANAEGQNHSAQLIVSGVGSVLRKAMRVVKEAEFE